MYDYNDSENSDADEYDPYGYDYDSEDTFGEVYIRDRDHLQRSAERETLQRNMSLSDRNVPIHIAHTRRSDLEHIFTKKPLTTLNERKQEEYHSKLKLSKSELQTLIAHVVFPSELSKGTNSSFCKSNSNDPIFLRLLSSVINDSTPELFQSLIPNTSNSVKIWLECQPRLGNGIIRSEYHHSFPDLEDPKSSDSTDSDGMTKISKSISSLQSGDILPFYIQSYNLALFISKSRTTDPDSVIISWSQIAANPVDVNAHHKLKASYPEYSFIVPFSDLIKSEPFAKKLLELQLQTSQSHRSFSYAQSNKNADNIATKLIQWLTATLMGSKDPLLTQSDSLICIEKSVRDEALSSEFRRSGLWATLKISLQLCLVNELGLEKGTFIYKLIMLELLRQIIQEHNNQDCIISMEMLAKLAYKIEKFEKFESIIENKSSEEISILQLAETILNNAVQTMEKSKAALDANWQRRFIKSQSLPHSNKYNQSSSIQKRRPDPNQKKFSYSVEYPFNEDRMERLEEYLKNRKINIAQSNRQTIQSLRHDHVIGSSDNVGFDNFEKLIRENQRVWTPTKLQDATMKYMKTIDSYIADENPITCSRFILTLLKSLHISDQIATKKYPLILKHNLLEFDISSVIQKLVLPTHEESDLAAELEMYFQNREKPGNYPSLISELEPSYNSVGVRIAQINENMKQLKTAILETIRIDEEATRIAIEEGIVEYKRLEVAFRDAECTCEISEEHLEHRRRHPNYHFHDCQKNSTKREMESYKINAYVYPFPMASSVDQDAVVFELLIPEEVAVLRDILLISFVALSPDDNHESLKVRLKSDDSKLKYEFNPWSDHLDRLKIKQKISRKQLLFYLGSKSVNAGKISPLKPQHNFFVKNNPVKYIWRTRLYRPKVSFHMKLEKSSHYTNLHSFLQDWSHTSNQVLTKQGDCSAALQNAEFVEFGSLRAGHRLQYRNIVRAMSSETLSFHSEEVFALISQAIWQLGPLERNSDENVLVRTMHADLSNNIFVAEMLNFLAELVEKTEGNWVASFTIMTVIVVTQRVIEFNPKLRAPATNLLKKCRKVIETWMKTITSVISEDPLKSAVSMKRYLKDAAICGALSFSVSSDLIPIILKDKADALFWLTCMGVIHDEVVAKRGSYNNPSESFMRRTVLILIKEAGHSINIPLNNIINQSHDVLNSFVKVHWGVSTTMIWSPIIGVENSHSPTPQIYQAVYQTDPHEPATRSSVIINIISGEFLVDGKPILQLPTDILRSEDYRRVFQRTEFPVRSAGKKLIFRTTNNFKGAYYEFEMKSYRFDDDDRNSHSYHRSCPVIITERRGTAISELIPLNMIEKELPFLLVQEFSHWWNRGRNTVEFRPKLFSSSSFATPQYILYLNTKDLVEVRTKNIMTYIGETAHDKILNLLGRVESPKYILIWKESGEIVAKLPRFGLSFRWQDNGLVCQEYSDMNVLEDPSLETLIGLRNCLVLVEAVEEDFLKTKKILVPHGELIIKQQSLSINTTEENLRTPPYFAFEMDSSFRTLKAGQSPAAWLYLAALHGATSSYPFLDPFTGLTGTERAMIILQSGHCWSCKPYDNESISTLKFISNLSPKRKMRQDKQDVTSIDGLSAYAAFDGYQIVVKKLIDDSNRLAFLFPTDESSKGQPSCDNGTVSTLNVRAYWKYIANYNQAAWIKSEFLPEFTQPPKCGIVKPTERFTKANLTNLRIISSLTEQWKAESRTLQHTHTKLNDLVYDKNQLYKFEGVKPSSFDDLINLGKSNLRDYWMQLYARALKCGRENLRSEWKLLLCDLIFNKEIDIDHLCLLHIIAVNHDQFPNPPSVREFKTIDEVQFVEAKIKYILESNKSRTDWYCSYSDRHDPKKKELKDKWDSETASEISNLVSDFRIQCGQILKRFQKVKCPGSDHLDIPRVSAAVNDQFKSWSNNVKLKLFIKTVSDNLDLCIQTCNSNASNSYGFKQEVFDFKKFKLLSVPFNLKTYSLNVNAGLSKISAFNSPDPEATRIYRDGLDNADDILPHQGFQHFQSKRSEYINLGRRLLEDLERIWTNPKEQAHLIAATLSPRIVPITIFPKILDQSLADSIKDQIGAIAVVCTYERRATRIMKYILAEESKEVNRQRELNTLAHQNWSPKEYPEWLLLELEMNVTIRNVQIDVAKHMLDSSKDSSVTQLNMGEGKTSLIVPMLVSTLTRPKNACVRVTVLKSLYGTNYKGLVHTLGGLINNRVYVFPCIRDFEITPQQADLVVQMHKEIIQKRGMLLTVPEYRLSWELRAYESAGKDTFLCRKLLDLVNWLQDNARDILDESDEILSVKYQKVYAMGTSGKIDEVRWKVTQGVLKKLPKILNELVSSHDNCIEIESAWKGPTEMFTRCRLLNYTDQSDACYQELIVRLSKEFISEEFSKMNQAFQNLMFQFLTNPAFSQMEYETLISSLVSEPLNIKFQKATVMAELFIHPGVLQSALSKRWKVNFGVNPKGQRRIAVPFR